MRVIVRVPCSAGINYKNITSNSTHKMGPHRYPIDIISKRKLQAPQASHVCVQGYSPRREATGKQVCVKGGGVEPAPPSLGGGQPAGARWFTPWPWRKNGWVNQAGNLGAERAKRAELMTLD